MIFSKEPRFVLHLGIIPEIDALLLSSLCQTVTINLTTTIHITDVLKLNT